MSSREALEQAAQRVGIAPSHYDIDGHLIYASDESLAYFTELLQPPSLELTCTARLRVSFGLLQQQGIIMG